MAVTAGMVKELREMTGAGMMDCKKALAATDGDMDKAVEFLREKGLAGAAKKAGRIAAEGVVVTALTADEKKAVVVEVNAETDFVAKNEKFQTYAADVAAQALKTTAADMDAFMAEKWEKDPTLTVKEALSSQISIIGENMNIRRFEKVTEKKLFEIAGDEKFVERDTDGKINRIYLYNDRTNPQSSNEYWNDYFSKIKLLSRFERK
mgnify:FL=1